MNRKNHALKIMMATFVLSGIAPLSQAENNTAPSSLSVKVASTKPGTILSVQSQMISSDFQHAGQRYLMTYRSRGVNGEPIVTSGFILLPKGQAPKQGWPILAWAHGTTGVADTCAPSADYPNGPVNEAQQVANAALDHWLEQGYAIAATDYQGLGTPGIHPYMNVSSQLHAVVDAVRATHAIFPRQMSKEWMVMGHSQGGAATLAVAAYGQKDAPEFKLRGAIALAPGGYQYEGIAEYAKANPYPDTSVAAFFPIVLLGAQAADQTLVPDQLVGEQMKDLLNLGRKRCLSELQSELKQAPDSIFKADVNLEPLLSYLKQQSIERMTPSVPLAIVQGTADHLVDYRGTYQYYQQVCQENKPAVYYTIPNGDHRDAVRQSAKFSAEFMAVLDQGKIPSSCSALQNANAK